MNPHARALCTRSRRARTPGHQVHSQPWLIDAIGLLPDEHVCALRDIVHLLEARPPHAASAAPRLAPQ